MSLKVKFVALSMVVIVSFGAVSSHADSDDNPYLLADYEGYGEGLGEGSYEGDLQVRFCEGHCATPNYKLNLNKKEG
jgi:hypothetical protein